MVWQQDVREDAQFEQQATMLIGGIYSDLL